MEALGLAISNQPEQLPACPKADCWLPVVRIVTRQWFVHTYPKAYQSSHIVEDCRIRGRAPECHKNKSRNGPSLPADKFELLDVEVSVWSEATSNSIGVLSATTSRQALANASAASCRITRSGRQLVGTDAQSQWHGCLHTKVPLFVGRRGA